MALAKKAVPTLRDSEHGNEKRLPARLPLVSLILWVITLVGIVVVLLLAFFYAPTDAVQGQPQRIFYVHVPAAWVGMLAFMVMAVAGVAYLIGRDERWDWIARAAAEIGTVFITLALITGSIWGRTTWGIWWTWDARLTTTLVLWLIYMSYLLLRRFAAGPQMQTLAAVLGIFGALDVPIVYMSNRWWRTQHPAPVFGGAQGSGMAPSMLGPFMWNMAAWFAWGVLILGIRYAVERHHQQIAAAEARAALEA